MTSSNAPEAATAGSPPGGRAVVLGAGGVVGTAWMLGLAAGLREHGVHLADADLIVGTSAGAIVGAILATGQDPGSLAAPRSSAGQRDALPAPDPRDLAAVFAVLGDPELDPMTARRRVGRLALASEVPERAQLAQMEALIAAREWPDRRLLITTVDSRTGERRVWDRTTGAPFIAAVTSSMAFPGAAPPITVDGRRYVDGGLWSATNADLAAGAGTLVVVEPLAHLFPRETLQRELSAAAADTMTTITPDAAAVAVLDADLYDRAAWPRAYQAGSTQAAELAGRLHAVWLGESGRPEPGRAAR
jgi:NTE family protein